MAEASLSDQASAVKEDDPDPLESFLVLDHDDVEAADAPETLWDLTPASLDFWRMDSQTSDLQSPSEERCADDTLLKSPCASSGEEAPEGFPVEECRLVLLGKTGSGKSSTGNTILGIPNHFRVSPAFRSATGKCQQHSARRFGVSLQVVDTPGFFDTTTDDNSTMEEVVKCLGLVSPGPHALLIVLPIGRFTREEADTIQWIRSLFGEDIMRHLIIVFTHGDDLEEGGMEDVLSGCPPGLLQLLEETERRYVVFNNKEGDRERGQRQVLLLLETVRRVLNGTCNQHYSNDLTQRCQHSVTKHAAHLSALLRGQLSGEVAEELLRASLEANDRAQSVLQDVLTSQDAECGERRKLQDKLRAMADERYAAYEQINLLFSQSDSQGAADTQEQLYLLHIVLTETERLCADLCRQLHEERGKRQEKKPCAIL